MTMLRSITCAAALVASVTSFAPPTLPANKASVQRCDTTTTAKALPSAMEVQSSLQFAAGFPAMYALLSVNEYITHRYYQHNELGKWPIYKAARELELIPKMDGGGHVEHHAETYDDMSLKVDDAQWMAGAPAERLTNSGDPWRGTAFTWQVTAMMIAQCIPTVYPTFYLLGWSPSATTALYLPAMLLHSLVWNALHPNMHDLPDVPASIGPPSSALAGLRGTPYFVSLYENHQGHHVASGRANYNVCCPGVDHLVGTYMATETWQPKMREKTARPLVGALSAAEM